MMEKTKGTCFYCKKVFSGEGFDLVKIRLLRHMKKCPKNTQSFWERKRESWSKQK